jgi:hypothetical protein
MNSDRPGSHRRADQASSGPKACRSPGLRSLLVPYALSDCREPEAIAFEAHILSCDRCFEDLQCLDRAGSLLQQSLRPASAVAGRVRLALRRASPRDETDPAT